jgi:hypothetical protein
MNRQEEEEEERLALITDSHRSSSEASIQLLGNTGTHYQQN